MFYRATIGMWGLFCAWAAYWTFSVTTMGWFGALWLATAVVCAVAVAVGRDLSIRIGLAVVDVMLAVGMFLVVIDAEPFQGQFLVFALLAVNFVQVAGMLFSPLRGLVWNPQ